MSVAYCSEPHKAYNDVVSGRGFLILENSTPKLLTFVKLNPN
jgi:hypothetical protein